MRNFTFLLLILCLSKILTTRRSASKRKASNEDNESPVKYYNKPLSEYQKKQKALRERERRKRLKETKDNTTSVKPRRNLTVEQKKRKAFTEKERRKRLREIMIDDPTSAKPRKIMTAEQKKRRALNEKERRKRLKEKMVDNPTVKRRRNLTDEQKQKKLTDERERIRKLKERIFKLKNLVDEGNDSTVIVSELNELMERERKRIERLRNNYRKRNNISETYLLARDDKPEISSKCNKQNTKATQKRKKTEIKPQQPEKRSRIEENILQLPRRENVPDKPLSFQPSNTYETDDFDYGFLGRGYFFENPSDTPSSMAVMAETGAETQFPGMNPSEMQDEYNESEKTYAIL